MVNKYRMKVRQIDIPLYDIPYNHRKIITTRKMRKWDSIKNSMEALAILTEEKPI